MSNNRNSLKGGYTRVSSVVSLCIRPRASKRSSYNSWQVEYNISNLPWIFKSTGGDQVALSTEINLMSAVAGRSALGRFWRSTDPTRSQ